MLLVERRGDLLHLKEKEREGRKYDLGIIKGQIRKGGITEQVLAQLTCGNCIILFFVKFEL